MPEQSIDDFVASTTEQKGTTEAFAKETSELLEVNVSGRAWARVGSMIAYTGNVNFERESAFSGGISNFIKKKLTGEGTPLMSLDGNGRVYLADQKKKVSLFDLSGEAVSVNGNDLLAFDDGIDWDIEMMKSGSGMMTGGLFNVKLSGRGTVAITSHGKPLTIEVTPGRTVHTDPEATVAWSGSLSPSVESAMSFKSLFGRGSGEAFQLAFDGDGWVIVQPFEEQPLQQGQGKAK
jgi:uncharacterized protein (AIM24 family)